MSSRLGVMMYADLEEVSNLLDSCSDAGEVAGALMNVINHVRRLETRITALEKMAREQSAINNGMDPYC